MPPGARLPAWAASLRTARAPSRCRWRMREVDGPYGRAAAADSHRFPLAAGQNRKKTFVRKRKPAKQKNPNPDGKIRVCLLSALGLLFMARNAFPATNPSQGYFVVPAMSVGQSALTESYCRRSCEALAGRSSDSRIILLAAPSRCEFEFVNSGLRGFRPRLQRRVRPRFSRGSLSERCPDAPATESYALASSSLCWLGPAQDNARGTPVLLHISRHIETRKSMQKNPAECGIRGIFSLQSVRGQ
jgi:hypothetical protein